MKNFILLLFLFATTALGQNLKLPQLNPILNSQLASNDVTVVSDISANESKKLSIGELDKRWQWTATSPLLKTGSESSVLSIPAASSSVNGYLSSADWTTFNAKQATIGATAPLVFSSNTVSIPAATASVHGYLASNDWTTFNAKVGTSTTDVLTNKDIDGGTASNTRRITLPKDTKTNLDALTRKQGTIVYDTTSNKPYYDNGTVLTAVGSGSGGGKNYITGGDAESGTTGFSTYADAAGTAPVDGTGGSASVTWATSATTPLENLNSFIFTKGATNRQGDGVSYPFTIDLQDRAKVLKISFSYLVNSGTFVAGTNTTASDVTIWIYDVTNSVIIQPSSINLLSNSTTIADKFSATFQTAGNSSSYRLIFHVGSTSASAYSLKIDDIKTEPSQYVYGTPITDWVTFTPTGTWSTNTTYSGRWRRVANNMEWRMRASLTGAPNATSLGFNYPSGFVLDTNAVPANTSDTLILGSGVVRSAASNYDASAYNNGGTGVFVTVKGAGSTYTALSTNVNATTPATFANGDLVEIYGSTPILGWTSSTQMSDTNEGRQIVFLGQSTGVSATANVTNIPFTTVKDSLGTAWNGSVYKVQTPGDYTVSTYIYGGSTCTMYIYLNGSVHRAIAYSVGSSGGAGTLLIPNLKSGDTISLRSNVTQTFSASSDQYLSIFRHAGPQTISANESINVRATNTAGTSISTAYTDFPFATINKNSHGFWNGTTFTPSIPGFYVFCGHITASVNLTTSQTIALKAVLNGSDYAYDQAPGVGVLNTFTLRVCDGVQMVAGDALKFQAVSNAATTASTFAGANYVYIFRQGN